ncbi:hypothetical protein Pla175_19180 [Pirellulimonas nuda]|uniref:LamG-like jellyroll fold domain-containing protein n=1 Tax=Pirellulimonas nuda TaxID=2528009 RepID=A0A518DAM4_9BACT|nr:LamG-like jellyroll fold domain-containing protein [Pirellulimonas nuda]QDU88540.1 hypothetical protein Pla175_19180 [Pirellulimonas nuda]
MPVLRRFTINSLTGCTLLAVAAWIGQSRMAPHASAALVAHWTLEEGMGAATTPVVGGPAAEGSLFGGARWQTQFLPPVVGGSSAAIAFDGSPNAVLTGFDGVVGGSARTVAAWVRADPFQGDFGGSVVSWGDNVTGQRNTLRFNTAEANGVLGALRFEVQGDFIVGNAVVADGQWHHVALVLPDTDPDGDLSVDLDDARLYVNGVLDADLTFGFSGAGGGNPAVNTTVSAGSEVTLGNAASGVAVTNVNLAQRGLRGALDDVRIYDNALTPGEVASLAPILPGKFGVEISRQTGAVSFVNTTVGDINFVAYTLSSDGGALDASAWASFADSDPGWLEFDGTANNLSEGQQPGGSGRTIASAAPAAPLGSAWIQNPVEDVVLTLLAADGSALSIPAIYTGAKAAMGDLNFDGGVDDLDWPTYRAGLFADLSGLSGPQQYRMGDLNGDGRNNELDFLLFKAAFDANLGTGAFEAMTAAAVPEPATYALLLTMIALAFLTKEYPQVFSQRVFVVARRSAPLIVVMVAIGVESAHALVVWTGAGANPNDLFGDDNYDFSGSSISAINETVTTGLPEVLVDAPVLDNVTFFNATIDAAYASGFGQFRLGNGFNLTLSNTSITSTTNGGIAGQIAPGTAMFNLLSGSNLNMQFVTGAVVNVDGTSTLRFRGGGDPINSVDQPARVNLAPGAMLTLASAAEFTEQGDAIFVNGVSFAANPGILSINGTTATAIGATLPLALEVNTTTGVTRIINQSGGAITTNFYKLTSETGSLDVPGWNSLQSIANNPGQNLAEFPRGTGSGNGWEEAGGSNNGELGEAFLSGDSTLSIGDTIELGSAFNQAGGTQDIMLRYYNVALNSFIDVEATYVSGGGVAGDYNGDGFVDSADYTVWRDNLGTNTTLLNQNPAASTPGVVDAEDYAFWKSRFGAPASGGVQSTAAVPEGEALSLLAIVLCAAAALSRACRDLALRRVAERSTAAVRLAAAATIVLFTAHTCIATITSDRDYRFGDDSAEDGSAGIAAGSGPSNALPGFTLDSEGAVGDNTLVDLRVFGNPQYVNVNALGRPQSASGALGISFSGDDFLEGERLGLPQTSYSSVASDNDPVEIGGPGPGSLNYIGIEDRGFQFWARPNAEGNGFAQSLVADTQQHGVRINAAGNWEMQYAGVPHDTGAPVAFNVWSHLMLVRRTTEAGPASLLYLDGQVVSAVTGGYSGADDAPLVIGASTGDTPGTADFYNGVLDDLEMFVMGVTKLPPYTNWGAFSPAIDNNYIASALSTMTPGDLTGDGQVTGNGAGSPLTDDVAAFLQNWDATYAVNNFNPVRPVSCSRFSAICLSSRGGTWTIFLLCLLRSRVSTAQHRPARRGWSVRGGSMRFEFFKVRQHLVFIGPSDQVEADHLERPQRRLLAGP